MSEPIRILIADDHDVVRDGLRLILESEDDFEVVGEAANGAEAVRLCSELHPQVVLMDLRMPGMDGLTAIKHIRQQQPDGNIVILTTYNEDALMIEGLRSGARSYLLKDTKRQVLFDTLRAAARGESLLSPDVIAKVVGQSAGVTTSVPKLSTSEIALTDREQEVLIGVARGERSKEIAARLGITERTVKAHLASIYNKFGVDSRAAAIAVASQRGLLPKGGVADFNA
ncbi:MAG TPA: response regulator transcription factor [Anaerolineae bacterium]|nr:response regulator transcription factor [Anaerolineae bacterium]